MRCLLSALSGKTLVSATWGLFERGSVREADGPLPSSPGLHRSHGHTTGNAVCQRPLRCEGHAQQTWRSAGHDGCRPAECAIPTPALPCHLACVGEAVWSGHCWRSWPLNVPLIEGNSMVRQHQPPAWNSDSHTNFTGNALPRSGFVHEGAKLPSAHAGRRRSKDR